LIGVGTFTLSFSIAATAAEHGLYAGAAVGESTMEMVDEVDPFFDEEDPVGKLFIGWRPLDWVAVEGGYVNLGGVRQTQNFPNYSDFSVAHTGYDVFGVFLLDIAVVDLFAKVGFVRWSGDLSVNTLAGPSRQSTDDTDYAWGLGAQTRFGKVALRLEYEHFETINSLGGVDPPHIISLGFAWTF
jgi:hypothetical protein